MGNIPATHRRTDRGLRHQEKARSVMRRAAAGGPFSPIEIDTLQAFADVESSDGNVEYVEFLSQVRPMTRVPGRPTIMVSGHPVKGADENSPTRGAGAILNLRRRTATSNCAGNASTHLLGPVQGNCDGPRIAGSKVHARSLHRHPRHHPQVARAEAEAAEVARRVSRGQRTRSNSFA
jgi:hypothetical protein